MAMTRDTDNKWLLQETSQAQTYTKELATGGKFVDANIKLNITAKDGTVVPSVTDVTSGSATIAPTGFTGSTEATGYCVTQSTSAGSAKATATVSNEGWVDSSDTSTSTASSVGVTGNGNVIYIPEANPTATASVTTAPVVAIGASATGFTASETTTSYYVTSTGAATAGTAKAVGGVTGLGMVGASETATDTETINTTVNNSGTKTYIPVNTITGSVVDLTAPSVAISKSAEGFTASSTATDYYVEVGATPTNGSVKGKATAGGTTGIVAANTTNTSNASTITPSYSGTGKVYIPAGDVAASISSNTAGSASMSTNMASPSSGTTDYYVTLSTTSGSVKAKASVGTEGYVKSETDETAATSVTVNGNGTKKYITAAALGASGSVTVSGSGTVNPGANTISKNSNTNVTVNATQTTKPSSGYYVAVDASTAANNNQSISVSGTGTASASVTTAGYAPSTLTGSGSVSGSGSATANVAAKSASTTYLTVPTTSYHNTATSGVAYSDISETAPTLISGSYLFIDEGWNPAQKISLKKLSPDGGSAEYATSDIVQGKSFYNNDGELVAGSLAAYTQTGGLVADSSKASGYSVYRVNTTAGYKKTASTYDITVYQGEWA